MFEGNYCHQCFFYENGQMYLKRYIMDMLQVSWNKKDKTGAIILILNLPHLHTQHPLSLTMYKAVILLTLACVALASDSSYDAPAPVVKKPAAGYGRKGGYALNYAQVANKAREAKVSD